MKVAVIGAGSWGSALAQVLASNNHSVCMQARKQSVVSGINEQHKNPRYLCDVALSKNITATTSLEFACKQACAIVVVVPSSILRSTANALAGIVDANAPIIICSKGVEGKTGLLPTQIFESCLGSAERLAVLSGPNHAEEVVRAMYAGTVIASSDNNTALFFRDLFATANFRAYTSSDVAGVEICAAFKNVIAIAVGIAAGLKLGDNAQALLMTRGLAEMSRLVVKCGGQALTCMGLAGTGDLIATCTSPHSRNRTFGEELAAGGTLDAYCKRTHMVVEGANACKTLQVLASKHDVELPITSVVRDVVWGGANVESAINQLINRPLKQEFYGV